MSSDIERIDQSMHVVHEIYACLLELGASLWLLYRLLGVSMVAPAIYAAGMTIGPKVTIKRLTRQSLLVHWSTDCVGRW